MAGIDATSRLAALMGAQVAAMRARAQSRPAGKPAQDAAVRQKPSDAPDLMTVAARRVQAIDPNDPQRARKAFRIFLEATLLAELGAGMVNDPAFGAMVDDVHRQMEADAELAPALAEAARLLLAPPQP